MSRPAAINAALRPVADYEPDPRGHRLAYALAARGAGDLNYARAVVPSSGTWFGWSKPLQRMTGAAAATAQGRARAIAPKESRLVLETTTTDVTTQAIFRSRMARQR